MPEVLRIGRAVLTNALAAVAPGVYLKLSGQTGRGNASTETPADIAAYFERCVADYLQRLGEGAFEGRVVVEYGPGDFPGVALLLLALGAEKVFCVDRFAMVSLSPKNEAVIASLRARLDAAAAARFDRAFVDPQRPSAGFNLARLEYVVTPHGFSGLSDQADLVISRAVLEHVNDLDGTFADMRRALRPGGRALHLVDLKSHGLHRRNPLDFLETSPWLWTLMFSHKGVPNRWRADRYRAIVGRLEVEQVLIEPTLKATADAVSDVRHRLAAPFRHLSDDDLACLGLWVGFRKPLGAA
ncbi:MAG: methyltransferase domain-containing protein [Betaproteobacteria bacterium]|jgi:SAM-dependent methyltransferase|nr:methyltransferase domain-containing protein [Rubrivivax sp.]